MPGAAPKNWSRACNIQNKTSVERRMRPCRKFFRSRFLNKGLASPTCLYPMDEKSSKFERYKSQKERYEAILDEIAREVEKITFSRASREEAAELKESEEKFREKSRKLWKEFGVHGVLCFDREEKKVKLLPFTDLDGKTCLGLFRLAGFNTEDVTYVPPGKFVPGAINLDTGEKTGIKVEDRTAWFDHHGPESREASICAARWVYLALLSKGFLKKESVCQEEGFVVSTKILNLRSILVCNLKLKLGGEN